MKKIIILVLALVIVIIVYQNSKKDYFVIPSDAIRFRIVANSDSAEDQYIKYKIKEEIEPQIVEITKEENIDTVRSSIKNQISVLENTILNTMKNNGFDQEFVVNYGLNYFPRKEYKGLIYEEGSYESLVVTLGEGKGDNWWCVLFPPICFTEINENDDVEYKLFITELFDKFK